jgi:hypothetical protein
VFFELSREKDQTSEEGLSDPAGSYEFAIISAGKYTISTRKTGYIAATKIVIIKPEMLQELENFLTISIPLIKALDNFDKRSKLAILSMNKPKPGL